MAETESGRDPIAEDERIRSLTERLERAEAVEKVRTGADREVGGDKNYRLGNRVLAELIGGLVGGALIGWVLDRFIGTSPWLLLVFLFLGIIVAFRNIWKISMKRPEK
ncbi:MAG: AtpZ/AtpI family protein [Alphaproteobacteria bacterium]|nr:AtpZ/AtpI family protein [Alphaproteobacteria bacterium]MBU0793151.1 AtpZ/AtpI family protein [Alphaproteobacteria bacterium]MBU0876874.1 AtpZ/AtpI family protein [Alphaproteobacteria bacterium]MBU1770441.1 AtpZ/AtpI family protein [Alphaproteobacteria bacterium]